VIRTLIYNKHILFSWCWAGKCRLRSVSIVLNIDGQVILKIKKLNLLMVFSSEKESKQHFYLLSLTIIGLFSHKSKLWDAGIVYNLHTKPLKEPLEEDVASYSINMTTSQGRVELIIDDYMQYRKWTATINHMLMLSATFGQYGNPIL